MGKKFSKGHENGLCPFGYEYVSASVGYAGTYTKGYCRKIKKFRNDPEEKRQNEIEKRNRMIEEQAWKYINSRDENFQRE